MLWGRQYGRRVFILLVVLLVGFPGLLLVATASPAAHVESLIRSNFAGPVATTELADTAQIIDFTLDAYGYEIVQFDYQASHLNEHVTYQLSFSVSGGLVEFFICSVYDAGIWAAGSAILISTSDHWSSIDGLNITRGIQSNVAYAFVFNHEGSGSRTVTGSIAVDTTPPSIVTSLVDNQTCSGNLVITASATDAFAGVHEIALFVDEELKLSDPSEIDYLWVTNDYSDGNHTIVIFADDEDYNYAFLFFTVWVNNHPAIPLTGFLLLGVVGLVAVLAGYSYWHWNKSRTKLAPQTANEL